MNFKGWDLLSLLYKPIIFSIAVLLIFGTFFSTLTFIPSPKKAHAIGGTYYVAKTGSDLTGDGSIGNPWLTLQKAHDTTVNEDIIHIGAGMYAEAGAGSVWRITKGQTWIADGTVTVRGSGAGLNAMVISGTSQANFYDIIFDGEGRTSAVSISVTSGNKYFSGCTFENGVTQAFYLQSTSDNVICDNCTFTGVNAPLYLIRVVDSQLSLINPTMTIDSNTYGVYLSSATSTKSFTMTGGTANLSTKQFIISMGNYDVTVDGMDITLNGGAPSIWGVFVAAQDGKTGDIVLTDNVITCNTVTSDSLVSISGLSTYTVVIERNTINQNAVAFDKDIIRIQNQTAISIKDNTINNLSTGASAGINIKSSGQDVISPIVQNNTINTRGLSSYGIAIGSETTSANDNRITGIIIEDNTVRGAIYYDDTTAPSLHSIFVGFNKQAIVRNNFSVGSGYGIVIKGGAGTDYVGVGGVYNNVFANHKVASVYSKGVENVNIYNNTFYTKSNIVPSSGLVSLLANPDNSNPSSGANVTNNIVYGRDSYDLAYIDTASMADLVMDYNVYWNNNSTNFQWDVGSITYTSLAPLQALGFETHSSVGNSSFVNASTLDFNLQSNSSAIDAGLDNSISPDYARKQRYDDPDVANTGSGAVDYYDIGAYEYVTPPSPSITSSTHPNQAVWYISPTPTITVNPTSPTTSYNYLVTQTQFPTKSDVEAGEVSASGSFTVPSGVIDVQGAWYIHMIGKNLDGDYSLNYSTYVIQYASLILPESLPEVGSAP